MPHCWSSVGISCRASSHLIVTRQCHGEAREIMIEKMRFILYQLPTGWMWLGKSNLASVCFLLAFDLVHRTEQVQLAADTKLTSGTDVVDTRHLKLWKEFWGSILSFLSFGSVSWLIFFTGTVLELLRLWFYHVGKFAKCVHWKYRNNKVCIMRSCPLSMMVIAIVFCIYQHVWFEVVRYSCWFYTCLIREQKL